LAVVSESWAIELTYPHERETDIALRDGATVHVRPIRAEDEAAIRAFLEALSPESIGFRFFGSPSLTWATKWSLDVDYADRFGLVAVTGDPPEVVAHAAYARMNERKAEVAFLVADAWQERGISTILLAHLAEVADHHGIATFLAEVLPHNHRMIGVFRASGFPVDMRSTPDAIEIELPTSLKAEGVKRFQERDRIAAVAAARAFFAPRSVAVIGASRHRGTVGGEILHNLLAAEFQGVVYAVNRDATVVQSLPGYRSIGDIGAPVDLAVVAVPAESVVPVAHECAVAGVRALLVISAGFGEAGEEGAGRQHELVEVCRERGMRLVGPNCLGVINTAPEVRLNATFAPRRPARGRIGFMSQSGSFGIAIIEAAERLGVGLSSFVSVGNKVDLTGNEFLQYWEGDRSTDVAMLYLESVANPRKFARLARRIGRRKPVLVVKSGRSAAGARATSSHTGARISASDVTVEALFEQAGVIRADTLHELFQVAALVTKQPIPRGERVVIVTNGGGPGIMCADACQANGVVVPPLSPEVRAGLEQFLPAAASVGNPVDMLVTASAENYRRTLGVLLAADVADAIITIFVPPLVTRGTEVAAAIREVAEDTRDVLLCTVFMTSAGPPAELSSERVEVPVFEFPEDAARAVALAARHGRWRARGEGTVCEPFGAQPERAAAIISGELGRGGGWLSPARAIALLNCYGLPLIETRVVADAEEAVAAAVELETPVALKASAWGLVGKTKAGAVKLGLPDGPAILAAAAEIEANVGRAGYRPDGLIVQKMSTTGIELIVGMVHDPSFGPVLACGPGAKIAGAMNDIAVRITPVTDLDAREMLRALQSFSILEGGPDGPRHDVAALEQLLMGVSAMVEAHPEIAELDLNPVVVSPDGALILDAMVRVEAAPPPTPMPSLDA
jgi:acetate---CoA ligase (ADP-forming)